MPHRFGILFVANGSSDDDAMENAAVALVRAFSFIQGEKNTKEAFDFVTEVFISFLLIPNFPCLSINFFPRRFLFRVARKSSKKFGLKIIHQPE